MLYIIKHKAEFLANFLLSAFADRTDVVILDFEKVHFHGWKKPCQMIIRLLRSMFFNRKGLWSRWLFPEKLLCQLAQIGTEDKVLLFSMQNLKDLLVLDKEIDCAVKSVYLWNPLCTVNHNAYSRWRYAHFLHRSSMRIYTFDPQDAKKYDFNLVNQIYRFLSPKEAPTDTNVKYDVFFVGKDKHRAVVLENFLAECNRQHIICDFHLLRDKHCTERSALMPYYSDQMVPYAEYCKRALQSKSILEVVQRGQSGMTMRPLEALFLQKKLITTNADANTLPFYHPDNIYILDGSEKRTLREFLDIGFHHFPRQVLEQYDIEHWIKHIV